MSYDIRPTDLAGKNRPSFPPPFSQWFCAFVKCPAVSRPWGESKPGASFLLVVASHSLAALGLAKLKHTETIWEACWLWEQAAFPGAVAWAWVTAQDPTKSHRTNNCCSSQRSAIQQHGHFPSTKYESPSLLLWLPNAWQVHSPFPWLGFQLRDNVSGRANSADSVPLLLQKAEL